MSDPFFFGYGSLVNRSTHDYPRATRARVRGWARSWKQTNLRKVAFLTAVGGVIFGLMSLWLALRVMRRHEPGAGPGPFQRQARQLQLFHNRR